MLVISSNYAKFLCLNMPIHTLRLTWSIGSTTCVEGTQL